MRFGPDQETHAPTEPRPDGGLSPNMDGKKQFRALAGAPRMKAGRKLARG